MRTAVLADSASATSVLRASFETLYRGWYRDAVLDQALPALSRANPSLLSSGRYFVAELDRRVIACGGWSPENPAGGTRAPGIAHIRHFATHPDFVQRGAAGAILARCLDEAKSAGFVEAEALSSLPAEAFYAGRGFRPIATVHVPIAGAAFACILMRRPL